MTVYLPRSAWTSRGPARALAPMPGTARGVAVHWPGDPGRIGTDEASIARRLEGYRSFHVNGRGWSDIAYQVAVDLAGRVWDLRGIGHQSAANGDQTVNEQYGACLFLVGADDAPSAEMLRAFSDWYRDRWLARYPEASAVRGHRDVRPAGTDCPGPATYALIKAGKILQAPTPEDDMPLTDADVDKVVDGLLGRAITTGWQEDGSYDSAKPLTIPLSKVFAGDRGASLHAAAGVEALAGRLAAIEQQMADVAQTLRSLVPPVVPELPPGVPASARRPS